MNLSERDKKVVVIGGIAALAILVIGYGIIPLLKSWSGSSGELSSKAAYVNDLQERIDSQGALLKQRNALAKRMGSLFEAPDKPEPKKGEAKKDKGSQTPESPKSQTAAATTPESPKPETVAAVTPETPKPETVAAVSPESPKPEVQAKEAQSPESPKGEAPAVVASVSPESPKGETKPGEKKDEKPKPEAATGATLAGYVEQNAKKAEATVKSITPVKTSAGRRDTRYYRSVMLQVKLQCKAKGLVTLLQALERGDRFVKVEQIQIHREPNKDDMDVTLDVRAYESTGKVS